MEKSFNNQWDPQTLDLCSWLLSRASTVSEQITKYSAPPIDVMAKNIDGGWQKVNYGLYFQIFMLIYLIEWHQI